MDDLLEAITLALDNLRDAIEASGDERMTGQLLVCASQLIKAKQMALETKEQKRERLAS